MPASTRVLERLQRDESIPAGSRLWRELGAGGPAGNEVLTVLTAVLLLGLLAAEGLTFVSLRSLLSEHMFIGMVLVPVVGLKLASTGYRFVRYYTGRESYVAKGPPPLILRATAPLLVASSVAVLGTGVMLLFTGPGARGTWYPLHKLSFFVWLAPVSLHVLGHLTELPPALRSETASGSASAVAVAGRAARLTVLLAALAAGVVLALLVLSQFPPWLHANLHHHGR